MTPGEDEKSGIVLAHAARIPFVNFVIVLFLNIVFYSVILMVCKSPVIVLQKCHEAY